MQMVRDEEDTVAAMSVAIFRLNGLLSEAGNVMVRDIGLTTASWQVLGALTAAGAPITVAQIARNMGLKRQSVQRTADMVAEQGLVRFIPNPTHARAKLVALTEEGRAAMAGAMRRQAGLSRAVIARLGKDRVSASLEFLIDLQRLLETIDAAAAAGVPGRRSTPVTKMEQRA